jgi:hypothetical protein
MRQAENLLLEVEVNSEEIRRGVRVEASNTDGRLALPVESGRQLCCDHRPASH